MGSYIRRMGFCGGCYKGGGKRREMQPGLLVIKVPLRITRRQNFALLSASCTTTRTVRSRLSATGVAKMRDAASLLCAVRS